MTYRDIVVQVEADTRSKDRALAAARLAQQFGARLEGVFPSTSFHVEYFTTAPFFGMSLLVTAELVAEHDADMAKAAEAARLSFEAAAGEIGVSSDWTVIDADTPAQMIAFMRRCDLTVLPAKPSPLIRDRGLDTDRLGLSAGGPCLILPEGWTDRPIGRRVLVAWNGGREAARALRDALPLMAEAEKVFVVIVAPHGDGGPDGLLQRHLERYGCAAEVIVDRHEDYAAGAILLEHVERLEIDLLVSGLYGHSRTQEVVLGGVSRDLLNRSPAPLLLSH